MTQKTSWTKDPTLNNIVAIVLITPCLWWWFFGKPVGQDQTPQKRVDVDLPIKTGFRCIFNDPVTPGSPATVALRESKRASPDETEMLLRLCMGEAIKITNGVEILGAAWFTASGDWTEEEMVHFKNKKEFLLFKPDTKAVDYFEVTSPSP